MMMRTYWTCSKLADRIRGTKKPRALGLQEWNAWHLHAYTAHPVRYWVAEILLDRIQRVVTFPERVVSKIAFDLRTRFITRDHILATRLPTGSPEDVSTRILHGSFEALRDYVEVDLAWRWAWSRAPGDTVKPPPRHSRWIYPLSRWRSVEAGLAHLHWWARVEKEQQEEELTDTAGAEAISGPDIPLEILSLYEWWTSERPLRSDPYDPVPPLDPDHDIFSLDEMSLDKDAYVAVDAIFERYRRQDEKMMVRLIRIAPHLL
jgi:hypothetical protein